MRHPTILIIFLSSVLLSPSAPAQALYREALRPQIHFTAQQGWINDPNGLIHLDGTWHLFYQHLQQKHWGHATSTDLLHWKEQPIALRPHAGHQVYSGCAVLDEKNTAGLQTGSQPPLIAIYTSWGEGQCLASSNDGGQTWARYEKNPILTLPSDKLRSYPLTARDPNVFWHEPTARWVMLLYQNLKQVAPVGTPKDIHGGFGIYSSPDLKAWKFESHLPDFYVCPDLFTLPVEGEPGTVRWVVMDWAKYALCDFDGHAIRLTSEIRPLDFGAKDCLSANQTWKNMPADDARRIQISWLRGGKYPGMPFDQQLSFPVELKLRRVGNDLVLCKQPIVELKALHHETRTLVEQKLLAEPHLVLPVKSHTYELDLSLALQPNDKLTLTALGHDITLEPNRITALGKTTQLPLNRLRLLADVTSLELFFNDGEQTMTFALLPPAEPSAVVLKATSGAPIVRRADLHLLKSVW